jgi:hypothetical protein
MHVKGFDIAVCDARTIEATNFMVSNYIMPDMQDTYTKEMHEWQEYLECAPYMWFPNLGILHSVYVA